MAQSTARQLEAIPKKQEQTAPIHKTLPKVRSTRVPFSGFEIMSAALLSLLFMGMMILVISSKVNLSSTQYELQNVNQKIVEIQNDNVNTKQEVSELSNKSRLMKVAQDAGLTMNDNSIRNVSK
ncbi:cell division protein FtsL [Liquorilactobacillus mali]|nr:cell division protein FtsL [Liquorilactobacillus mali]EJE99101.1 cell division protein FtsL [Liquorilactobacillus mali KCTC 3596 = DSM 20444]MDC7951947.1 cell division protein FtsL [Liquorilactobacillus mali]QFQ74958.1 cell division protein FtsL [Liquorilactobacillus mali]